MCKVLRSRMKDRSPQLRLQFAALGDKVLPNRIAALWAENQRQKSVT